MFSQKHFPHQVFDAIEMGSQTENKFILTRENDLQET
jgi:hypothetical protein